MATSSAKIWNKSITLVFICLFALLALSACGSETPTGKEINSDVQESVSSESADPVQSSAEENKMKSELTMKINGETVTVEWEDNESVSALRELASESPITIHTNLQLKQDKIQSRQVMLIITSEEMEQIVSQRRSTTLLRVAKTSFRNPLKRISFQICSIGFISGVYGGMWKIEIFSGICNPLDLCQAAPSQHKRI